MTSPIDALILPRMYKVRPYFEIKKVKIPDCMYLVKPLHCMINIAPSGEASTLVLSYLEQRQEWLLSQVEKLKDKVDQLGKQFGVGLTDVDILQQQEPSLDNRREVVISCPTSSPPYVLLALHHYICGCIPTSCRVYVHSSAAAQATDDLRRFFDGLPACPNSRLRWVLIWKSETDCPVATMMVSPHNQTPVEGVTNIARYLCREYFTALYEESKGGLEAAAQMDSWMDAISTTLQRGSSKEKASVVRRLNSHLGSASFLAGCECPSIADIVACCAISKQPGLKIPVNVKQWLKRCREAVPGLNFCPCSYLTGEELDS